MKSFGTILNDHPEVFRMSSSLKSSFVPEIEIPKNFNGNTVWSQYLSPILSQGNCGNCWAISTTSCLADRFNLFCLGQRYFRFSPYQLTICESVLTEKPSPDLNVRSQINLSAHSTKACYGNSIVSALQHLYIFGVVRYTCFTESEQTEFGIKQLQSYSKIIDLPECYKILGKEYDTCADKDTAARFFRCVDFYSIGDNVDAIKKDIYKFGPVIGGFMVFEDFLEEYDGKTIYMGPKNKDTKSNGGHAVRIVGWGNEDGVDYWWIANSWGQNWGLNGYFRMKIGIPECQLEKNVYGLIPDIPTLSLIDMNIPIHIDNNSIELRSSIRIDNDTGYKMTAVRKILDGELQSSFRSLFDNKKLPDYNKFIAGEIFPYPETIVSPPISPFFKNIGNEESSQLYNVVYFIVFILSFIFTLILLGKLNKK